MNDTARRFDVPELAGATVLVVVGLLALGGLVAGITTLWQNGYGVGPAAQRAANFLLTATSWAHPFTALFLFSAVVLLRWRARDPEATLTRTVQRWLEVALVVTAVGALAAFIGTLLSFVGQAGGGAPTTVVVERDVTSAAVLLSTIAVMVAGLLVGGALQSHADSAS